MGDTSDERRLRHVPALDGIRGLAVAGVLLFHAGHLRGGYLGVDAFFVLSGFLITSLLLAEWRATQGIALGGFWARRARRLLPALAGLLVGIGVYAAVFAEPAELANLRGDAWATLGYAANWREVFTGQDYFSLFAAPSPLTHAWSLAIEEQFYLLWPLLVLGLLWWRRSGPAAILGVSLVGIAASFVTTLLLYSPGGDTTRVYYGTDTRAAALLVGAALAAAVARFGLPPGRRVRLGLDAAAVAAVVGLAWAWSTVGGQRPGLYRGGLLACGLGVAVVIAAAAHPARGLVGRALAWRPLVALGAISYGLYLWHWPVYVVLDARRTGLEGWILTGLRVAVSLAIAIVSYFALEQPIRHGALSPRKLRVAVPAVAGVLVAGVFVTTAGQPPPTARASVFANSVEPAALEAPPPEVLAEVARDLGPPRLLLVGDSMAAYLGDAMNTVAAELGLRSWDRGVIGCGLADGRRRIPFANGDGNLQDPNLCQATWRDDVAVLRPHVVLVILGAPGFSEWEIDGEWRRPCTPEFDGWYEQALGAEFDAISGDDTRIALATTPDIRTWWSKRGSRQTADCVNAVHRRLADTRDRLSIVELDQWICPDGECRTHEGGTELRADGVHFEGEGALVAARWLGPQLLALSEEARADPGNVEVAASTARSPRDGPTGESQAAGGPRSAP